MNTASHVESAVTNFNGSGQASVKKNDGVSGGLSESRKARLRRNVPDYLRSGFSWLCFEFQTAPNRDRVRKVPIDPETGQYASYKDPAAWGTLEEAIAGCARFHADGVGYAFMHYANIVGLDLDNCRNPATGEIDQWARDIIREANSYSEVTPSGTGVRVFIDGKWRHPEHRTKGLGSAGKGGLEIYSEWFFAITGHHLRGTPREIERRSDVIERLHSRFFGLPKPSGAPTIRTAAAGTNDDAALIEKARRAEKRRQIPTTLGGEMGKLSVQIRSRYCIVRSARVLDGLRCGAHG